MKLQICNHQEKQRQSKGRHVYGFELEELVFYAFIWAAAFWSALGRSFASGRYSNRSRIGFCCTAGCASVCIIGILVGVVTSGRGVHELSVGSRGGWVAISTGLGLLGKEQHELMKSLLFGFLQGFKNAIDNFGKKADDE